MTAEDIRTSYSNATTLIGKTHPADKAAQAAAYQVQYVAEIAAQLVETNVLNKQMLEQMTRQVDTFVETTRPKDAEAIDNLHTRIDELCVENASLQTSLSAQESEVRLARTAIDDLRKKLDTAQKDAHHRREALEFACFKFVIHNPGDDGDKRAAIFASLYTAQAREGKLDEVKARHLVDVARETAAKRLASKPTKEGA